MSRFFVVSVLVLSMDVDFAPSRSSADTSLIPIYSLLTAADDKPEARGKKQESLERGYLRLKEKPIAFFKGDGKNQINSLTFSTDSKLLVAATDKSVVRIWHISEKQEKLSLKPDGMSCWSVRFSTNGKFLMTASLGKNFDEPASLALWDVSTWK